jgi:streptogramin lyase
MLGELMKLINSARPVVLFSTTTLFALIFSLLPSTISNANTNLQVSTFSGVGAGRDFAHPLGIAYSPDGAIYVADRDTYSIKKIVGNNISTIRQLERTSPGFHTGNEPCSIFSRTANEIYFSTCSNSTIYKINGSGTVLKTIQVNIPGWQKKFNWYSSIAIDSKGNIFLSDQMNHVILRVSESTGQGEIYAGAYGVRGSGRQGYPDSRQNARFNAPAGLAIDSKDNLYVAEESNNAIRIITSGGVLFHPSGLSCNVIGVGVDSDDRVFAVSNKWCGGVIREFAVGGFSSPKFVYDDSDQTTARNIALNISGKPLFAGSPAFSIDRWGANPTNQIAIGDFSNHNVKVISKDGQLLRTIGQKNSWGTSTSVANEQVYNHPTSIFALSDNTFILQDLSTFRHLSASGEVLHTTYMGASCWYSPLYAFSDDGIFFCREGNTILARFPDGSLTRIGTGVAGFRDGFENTAQFNIPDGAVFYQGDLYVADNGNRRIRKISRVGLTKNFQVTTVVGNGTTWNGQNVQPKLTASFSWPSKITFDSKGNMYIADGGIDSIFKVTPGANGTVTKLASGMKSWPRAMVSDSADRIYVTTERGYIYRLEGDRLTYLGGDGVGHRDGSLSQALFYGPTSLTIDNSGNLFVTEDQNQDVRKIRLGNDARGIRILDARNFRFLMKGAPAPIITSTGSTAPIQQTVVPLAPFDADIKIKDRKVSINVSMATSIDNAYLVANEIGITEKRPLRGKINKATAAFTFTFPQKHVGKNVRIEIYGINNNLRSPSLFFPVQLGKPKTPVKLPASASSQPLEITCKKGSIIRVFIAKRCPTGYTKR